MRGGLVADTGGLRTLPMLRPWQTPVGNRFLELNAELTMRSILREFGPPFLKLAPPPKKG